MYKVSIFNAGIETVIHYPTSNKAAPHLLKIDLEEKIGEASTLSFDILINNPGYNKIFQLNTLCNVYNLQTGKTEFEGRIYSSNIQMSSSGEFYKSIVAESEIAYLNDTCVRSCKIENISYLDFVTKILTNHNAHTTKDKQFYVGNIDVDGVVNCETNYESTLSCLKSNLSGGYLFVRKKDNVRYLDYHKGLDITSDDIILAHNMKSLSFTPDVSNIATRIIPIGENGLDITSVNNGVDYIEDTEAEKLFGIIEQKVELTDIKDAAQLKIQGQRKLNQKINAVYKLSTNILDLSTIKKDPNGFHVGTYTTIKCRPIGFEQNAFIIEKKIDLLNPQDCQLTLNDKNVSAIQMELDTQKRLNSISNFANAAVITAQDAQDSTIKVQNNLKKFQQVFDVDNKEISNEVAKNSLDIRCLQKSVSNDELDIKAIQSDISAIKDFDSDKNNIINLNYDKFTALMDELVKKSVITQEEENNIKTFKTIRK